MKDTLMLVVNSVRNTKRKVLFESYPLILFPIISAGCLSSDTRRLSSFKFHFFFLFFHSKLPVPHPLPLPLPWFRLQSLQSISDPELSSAGNVTFNITI